MLHFGLCILCLRAAGVFFIVGRPAARGSSVVGLMTVLNSFTLLGLSVVLIFFVLGKVSSRTVTRVSLGACLLASGLYCVPYVSVFKIVLRGHVIHPRRVMNHLLKAVDLRMIVFLAILTVVGMSGFSHVCLLTFCLSFVPLTVK